MIRQGNDIIRTVKLDEVGEPYEFTVNYEDGGYNVIRVEQGRIAVVEADCPDKVCVHRGYIENSAAPIVCLPHRLTITITGAGAEADSVAGIH